MTFRKIFVYIAAFIWTIPVLVTAQTTGIQNPLNQSYSTIPTFIAGFLKVMVQIGLPIVALALLYSGFLFIKAQGRTGEDGLDGAKKNFKNVIFGACLILGAWVLATLIGNTVSQVVGNGLS
jgi:hypothetical protein